nr:hypothetical protein GCM10025732_10020 [Glycomyces mayteni]
MSEPTDFPLHLPDMPLHDPYVVADAETGLYHLFTSNLDLSGTPGAGTMVYRSPNLRDWSDPVPVFLTADEQEPWARHGAWAPEVHRWNGRWYLFTTLHDTDAPLPVPRPGEYGTPFPVANYRRSTVVAVADDLTGPYRMLKPEKPILPAELMTLDGTLYVDDAGKPWMVYANEWLQRIDGTVEAFPLNDALDAVAGDPVVLFRGSDASWLSRELPAGVPHQIAPYVTDGPQLYRAPGGASSASGPPTRRTASPRAASTATTSRPGPSPPPAASKALGSSANPSSAPTPATACSSPPSTAPSCSSSTAPSPTPAASSTRWHGTTTNSRSPATGPTSTATERPRRGTGTYSGVPFGHGLPL